METRHVEEAAEAKGEGGAGSKVRVRVMVRGEGEVDVEVEVIRGVSSCGRRPSRCQCEPPRHTHKHRVDRHTG